MLNETQWLCGGAKVSPKAMFSVFEHRESSQKGGRRHHLDPAWQPQLDIKWINAESDNDRKNL